MTTTTIGRAGLPVRRDVFATMAATCLLSVSMPALAQSQSEQQPAGAEAGTDIVVTALRRDSTVQKTPLAITALAGDTLTNAGVSDVTDYAKFVPSLRVQDSGPGQRRISLRGVQASGEATVGVYYDDLPIAGSVGPANDAAGRTADLSLFDINRIEVLRGPQGTLYGSSSMGGAIRVIFNKPTQDYEGDVDASMTDTRGGGLGYAVNAMVNVPLSPTLAARAVLYRRDMDGWIDNVFLDRKNVNDYTATGGRAMLRWTPIEALTIDASAAFEHTNASTSVFNPDLGEYKSADQVLLPYEDKTQIYNFTGTLDLGFASLTSITGYQHRKSVYALDDSYYIASYRSASGCASYVNASTGAACSSSELENYYGYVDSLTPAAIYYPGTTKDFSQELRLSSSGDNLIDWTIGGFYENRKNAVISSDVAADATTGEIITPVEYFYRRQIRDRLKQFAAFAEVTYHATQNLSLTGGLRYFDYKKTVTGFTDIPWTLIGAPARPARTVDSSQDGTLLKFNVSWQAAGDVMFYATASQGFRPGGANQVIGLPDALIPYQSDSLWNYEVGTKLTLLDRRMTLNLSAYQIDWDNIQVQGRTANNAFSFLSNAGTARIRGFEAEANFRPVDGLTLSGSGTYVDAKLTQDQVNDVVVAAGRKGDRIPYIPHFSGSLSAEYIRPLNSNVDLYLRGDINYVGSSYSEFRPTSPINVRIPDYALTNLRFGLEFKNANAGVYVFVNNVFDAFAINRASNGYDENSYQATAAAPRTIGLNVRHSF